jgi:hypothetical protein
MGHPLSGRNRHEIKNPHPFGSAQGRHCREERDKDGAPSPESRFLATLAGFTGCEWLGMTRFLLGVERLGVERCVELIEQFCVGGEGAFEDFCLLLGGGPIFRFDGFG